MAAISPCLVSTHPINNSTSEYARLRSMAYKQLRVLSLTFIAILASTLPTCTAQSATGIYTTYHEYNPSANGYSLSGLYCDTYDGNQPEVWRSQYRWTAFCHPTAGGPMGPSLCGKCLRVTNPGTAQSVQVRILDQCSNGGLDLETDAFNAIDSDKAGYNAGHLSTNYEFMDC